MFDQLQFIQGKSSESAAQIYLRALADTNLQSFSASLYGPRCKYSRTLPSEFTFREEEPLSQSALVTEPCYWTPALPFLYDLQIRGQLRDGQTVNQKVQVGLRRWSCEGSSFRLESKRIVLRGTVASSLSIATLTQAREAENALIVKQVDTATLAAASELGVALIVDLRQAVDPLVSSLRELDCSPAVLMVLVTARQVDPGNVESFWPRHLTVVQVLSGAFSPDDLSVDRVAAFAVELHGSERPPGWLSKAEPAVIAIRYGESYAGMVEARAACDRLQAALAPEFDLAGYFVAP